MIISGLALTGGPTEQLDIKINVWGGKIIFFHRAHSFEQFRCVEITM